MYNKTDHQYLPHASQYMHVYWPGKDGKAPFSKLVVLIHGGFFKKDYGLGLMEPLAKDLVEAGYLVANIEYPRVGEKMIAKKIVASVFEAFKYATKLSKDITETAVIGHSAGGLLALLLGCQKSITDPILRIDDAVTPDKIIAQAPLTDLWTGHLNRLSNEGDAIEKFVNTSSMIVSPREDYDILSPISYEPNGTKAIHIVTGSNDADVPTSQGRAFFNKWEHARNHGHMTMHEFALTTHMNVIDPSNACWDIQKLLLKI